jgi:uncharacterized protein
MNDSAPWYKDGLRFTCTQCGKCCTGEPGFTWINDAEIQALAEHFGMDEQAFVTRYAKQVWRRGELRVSLREKNNGDCVFFQKGVGCTVYELRPKQCKTWPFWGRIVASRADWDDSARDCPGMNHGQRHDATKISEIAADDGLA